MSLVTRTGAAEYAEAHTSSSVQGLMDFLRIASISTDPARAEDVRKAAKAGVSGRSATWALTSTTPDATPDATLDAQAEPEATSNDTADGNWSEAEDARYAQTQEDENVTTDTTDTTEAEATAKPAEKTPRERAPRIGTLGVRHERGSVSDAIVAWLEDQGGEAYTPHNIAKALGDKTSGTGATAYSCDKLALAGRIAQAPGKPTKYQALTADQREAYEQAQREATEAAAERLATEAQAREAKQAEREAAKAAKVAAKEQAKADKRAAREAKQAEKEAEKAAKAQARADAKAAKEAEKAAAQAEATEDVTE
jgi:hypothetical protein